MTLFDLHERALSDYRDFVRSFIQIAGNTAGLFCSKTAAASGLSPANGSDLHGAHRRVHRGLGYVLRKRTLFS
jgi:hypothetical protein